MNIMIVTFYPLQGRKYFEHRDIKVYFRSELNGLKSLLVDTLILGPCLIQEQVNLAVDRTKASINPEIKKMTQYQIERIHFMLNQFCEE